MAAHFSIAFQLSLALDAKALVGAAAQATAITMPVRANPPMVLNFVMFLIRLLFPQD
jgi:hypothetical protein